MVPEGRVLLLCWVRGMARIRIGCVSGRGLRAGMDLTDFKRYNLVLA